MISRQLWLFFVFAMTFSFRAHSLQLQCDPDASPGQSDGYFELEDQRRLYWRKRAALQNPESPEGTVFFLAGGPLPQFIYAGALQIYQSWLPRYEFISYDYYGLNCSDRVQSPDDLATHKNFFVVESMARDFLQLKEGLIGSRKAVLLGGSFGAFLGAQIIADFPESVERAVLYSGDTSTGWFAQSWRRFDQILLEINASSSDFSAHLHELLQKVEAGEFSFEGENGALTFTREMFEVGLFMTSLPSSAAQAQLPVQVRSALAGETAWMSSLAAVGAGLISDVFPEEPPTHRSALTHFHRCNVWFPRSQRHSLGDGYFLQESSFIRYWNTLCADYDSAGEFPQNSLPDHPTSVPVLAWVGSHDYFDPVASEQRWRQLSSRLTFRVFDGWAHDFGINPRLGIEALRPVVEEFFADR